MNTRKLRSSNLLKRETIRSVSQTCHHGRGLMWGDMLRIIIFPRRSNQRQRLIFRKSLDAAATPRIFNRRRRREPFLKKKTKNKRTAREENPRQARGGEKEIMKI